MSVTEREVAAALAASGLRQATRHLPGWFEQRTAERTVAVFWVRLAMRRSQLPRPQRAAGLGAVVDALAARYSVCLAGRNVEDGAPVCVRVDRRTAASGRARAGHNHRVLRVVEDVGMADASLGLRR